MFNSLAKLMVILSYGDCEYFMIYINKKNAWGVDEIPFKKVLLHEYFWYL